MRKINLKLKTQTPLANFDEFGQHNIVCFQGWIYFINSVKLDKILSVVQKLQDFISFSNSSENKNITNWLKANKLCNEELLNEVSFYKLRNNFNDINSVHRFFTKKEGYLGEIPASRCLAHFVLNGLKNILLYDYLRENYENFNFYVENLLSFLEKSPNTSLMKSPNFFIKSILEIDKSKLDFEFQKFSRKLFFTGNNLNSFDEYFCLKKTVQSQNPSVHECFKPNLILNFEFHCDERDFVENKLEKFLKISEDICFQCQNMQQGKISSLNEKHSKLGLLEVKESSNFYFLNAAEVLFLNLSAENRDKLNEKLKETFGEDYYKEIPHLKLIKSKNLTDFNHARLTIL